MNTILTREAIARLAQEQGLIQPLIEEGLNPASYDLHIGDEIVVPLQGRISPFSLRADYQGRFSLDPGQTVVLYSLETVHLPLDIQGLLVLRASWATKGLYYAGGLVKPGYWGRLFFSVSNLSLHTIDLPIEEPLAIITFFHLPEPVGEEARSPITEIPPTFQPLPPARDIYSLEQLSASIDELREEVKAYRAADRTLTPEEIHEHARQGMIRPFDEAGLKGIAYDFRVGEKALLAEPGRLRPVSLSGKFPLEIPPGLAAVVESYEIVKMPWNIKGRLSIRSAFMAKRLNYDGGVIDPGYHGRLFFTVVNLGDTPIVLHYKERLVTAEFVALGEEVPPEIQKALQQREGFNPEEPLSQVPEERMPQPASERWFTLQDLSKKVIGLSETVEHLTQEVRQVKLQQQPANTFMELFVFAALVGLIVALFGHNQGATQVTNAGIWIALIVSMLLWLLVRWIKK